MGEDEKDYRAFLDGDAKGFERLVLRHKDSLTGFLRRYVRDVHSAEDLAQDAFVELLLHKERYHFKTGFKTYLFTIGRNKAVDYLRKYGRILPSEELPEQAGEERELLERLIRGEEREKLYRALYRLKEDYQRVVYLVDLEELSYREAAGILNKTLGQVRVLLYRARKALKKEMEKEGYGYDE